MLLARALEQQNLDYAMSPFEHLILFGMMVPLAL